MRDTGGAGIAGIYVEVYRYRPDWGSYEWVTYVQTGGDGTYDIAGLAAGPYRLHFSDYDNGIYVTEYYDNAAELTLGTDVWVVLDLTTGGIDAVLDQPGRSAGR